jgi:hypothetical protein
MSRLEQAWGKTARDMNMLSIQDTFSIQMEKAKQDILAKLTGRCKDFAVIVAEQLEEFTILGKFRVMLLPSRSVTTDGVFATAHIDCLNPEDLNLNNLSVRLFFNAKTWYVDASVGVSNQSKDTSFLIPASNSASYLALDISQELSERHMI